MTPPDPARATYLRRLIAHRCPEATEGEVEVLADDTLPVEIAEEIVAVIDLMEDRLTALEDGNE